MPTFVLVRWVEDNSIGVMPVSAAEKGTRLFPGLTTSMKWRKKKYEAEILKISQDNKHLNKLCDDLINFKITVEDIFEQEESVVSSTESSPVKVPTSSKAKAKKSASQRVLGLAKQMSSGRKSMEILSAISPNERPVVGSKRSLSSTPCTSKAAIDTATIRARQIFSSQDADTPNYDSDSEDEDVGISANEKLTEALEEIKRLKKQLNKSESRVSVTKNIVSHSTFDSLNKSVSLSPEPPTYQVTSGNSQNYGKQSVASKASPPSTFDQQGSSSRAVKRPLQSNEQSSESEEPLKRQLVELVPGYGIQLSQRQLDEALDGSNGSPTRLIRNLLSVFFSKDVLASSSAYGGRKNAALDRDTLAACLRYVQSKHQVSKTVLIDAVNDKCAQARRTVKKN